MEMDNDIAKKLFEKGAMIILLDVPIGTEIGIDMNSWHVDKNFKGIKMIPPGMHFIYFSSCGKDGQLSPRSGFFQNFSEKEIVVRKWDPTMETFFPQVTDEDEMNRYTVNKKELDRYCGPYPFERKWASLSQHLSQRVIAKLQPKDGYISSVVSLVSEGSDSKTRASMPKSEQIPLEKLTADNLLSDMKQADESKMNYTVVNRFLGGSDAENITRCAVDASPVLDEFIDKAGSDEDVLAEVQMAFICFLLGQQLDSFEHWKKCVALLCGCLTAIPKHQQLYSELISILHFQLKEMPEDFFVDIVSKDNFLTVTLHNLIANILDSEATQSLKDRVKKFSESLTKRFGWDFDSEPDDCAPVVVDEFGAAVRQPHYPGAPREFLLS